MKFKGTASYELLIQKDIFMHGQLFEEILMHCHFWYQIMSHSNHWNFASIYIYFSVSANLNKILDKATEEEKGKKKIIVRVSLINDDHVKISL